MRLCFVCLGNICRSPAAEALTQHLLDERGEDDRPGDLAGLQVSSAGTGPWHVGEEPHPHMLTEARRRGIPVDHRGYQFSTQDFADVDLIVAMDAGNVDDLAGLAPDESARVKIVRLGSFAPGDDGHRWAGEEGDDVPDPYGQPPRAFAEMFDQLEPACRGLLDWLGSGRAR
ncbi:MAG TPA: low molecular weight protein-tyrosine-phosphatase [Ornithinimicrobium sp.]|uniref:low molecular weight protein-tyrosine-phosphatase n=1 Tax=Ornithinimicrobium sp. TaxID=1977084 RepID=UPI002B45F7EF|nr:low molecular weight protein-tyrosine-phosphatase [Ornithinimicrobium sp.]HKJ11654.1 low molecular weight protein-tyrosine-phosphatase [Ornithinimicrobium sp.]